MKKKRNITLDIVRVAAATLIVLHHYQQGTGMVLQHINFYGGKFEVGYVVELFFVISGLLVYKNMEEIKKNKTLKEFFEKKFFRIVPLMAISVIVDQPTWYLSVLLFCYIVFYYGVRISKRLEISCNYIFIIFVFCGAIIGTYQWNTALINVSIGRGLFSFFLGVILADFAERHTEKRFEWLILVFPLVFLSLIKWKMNLLIRGHSFFILFSYGCQ